MANNKKNSSSNVDEKVDDKQASAPVPVGRQAGSVKTATTKKLPASSNSVKEEDSLLGDAKRTKEAMANEPKVSYIIPLGFGEKKGAYETVSINGYKLTIQKGVRVEIPLPFAKLLDEYLGIQENVGLDKRLDLDEEKQKVLS